MIAVSTSLLVLGWHFPSDVLGGLLVSSGFFFLAVAAIASGTAAARASRLREPGWRSRRGSAGPPLPRWRRRA